MGWVWISRGGVRYRAPYGAKKLKNISPKKRYSLSVMWELVYFIQDLKRVFFVCLICVSVCLRQSIAAIRRDRAIDEKLHIGEKSLSRRLLDQEGGLTMVFIDSNCQHDIWYVIKADFRLLQKSGRDKRCTVVLNTIKNHLWSECQASAASPNI